MIYHDQLGEFFLGFKDCDQDHDGNNDFMLLNSRELLTHGICLGMTGSGKTGLGISLIEEAALDHIPVIAIDPKGDLGNLLLTFPDLAPHDFEPWIAESEIAASGRTREEIAGEKAAKMADGLIATGQDQNRIRSLQNSADFCLYTPGGLFGRPLSLQGLFAAPHTQDSEIMEDAVSAIAENLLSLIGIKSDITSREYVLLVTIIRELFNRGQSLDLAKLVTYIQKPPCQTIGVMAINDFYPESERFKLSLQFNALLASPSFSSFFQGEAFNIDNLLYNPSGQNKVSILTLSHLSEAEKMFFVTLLLNNICFWMRKKTGTGSCRMLLYMDEIFGYFPPVANPPAKKPLLTLLKQARAFGVSLFLASQNPADIDYKGLSNIGTWMVGKLSTDRDRSKLLEGMSQNANNFSLDTLDEAIKNLEKRNFIVKTPSSKEIVKFSTRHTLSYMYGPLSREQINMLNAGNAKNDVNSYAPTESSGAAEGNFAFAPAVAAKAAAFATPAGNAVPDDHSPATAPLGSGAPAVSAEAAAFATPAGNATPDDHSPATAPLGSGAPAEAAAFATPADPAVAPANPTGFNNTVNNIAAANTAYVTAPSVPGGIACFYFAEPGEKLLPALVSQVSIFYNKSGMDLNFTDEFTLIAKISDSFINVDWAKAIATKSSLNLASAAPTAVSYEVLPQAASDKRNYTLWKSQMIDFLFRDKGLTLYKHAKLKMVSEPGETAEAFAGRVEIKARELRDAEMDELQRAYDKKRSSLDDKVQTARERVEREKDQAADAKRQSAVSFGSAILGSLLGRKVLSAGSISRFSTAAKSASRSNRQTEDIRRAQDKLENIIAKNDVLDKEMKDALDKISAAYDTTTGNIEEFKLLPLKKDISVRAFSLLWISEAAFQDLGSASPEAAN